MSLLPQRRPARDRRAELAPERPANCPVCGRPVEEDDHAVHVRRGAYHAECVLYRGRAERDRWSIVA